MRFRICILIFGLAMLISGSLGAQSPRISSNSPTVIPDDRPLCLPNPCLSGDTSSRILRMGLVADPQYCDAAPFNNRQFRLSPDKLKAAIDTFNRWKIDVLVNLGDIIDRGPESFRPIRSIYDRLKAPQYNLLGNHEFHQVPAELKPTILDSLDMGAPYCDFTLKGWRFILLDGTELAGYAREAHPDLAEEADSLWQSVQGKARGKPWNGGIGHKQREWLRQRLDMAAYHNEQVIMFCHFPIMPAGHHSNLWNDLQMRQLIRPYPNVVAWIAGHYHNGNYRFFQDVHHLTLRGMVMTADSNAFSVMDVYPDRIELHGFGREAYRRLSLRNFTECEGIEAPGIVPPAMDIAEEEVSEGPCLTRSFRDLLGRLVLVDDGLEDDFAVPDGLDAGLYRVSYGSGIPSRILPVLPNRE